MDGGGRRGLSDWGNQLAHPEHFLKDFIYLFEREKKGRGRGRRSRLPGEQAPSQAQDHNLSRRQMLNYLSFPGTPTGSLSDCQHGHLP